MEPKTTSTDYKYLPVKQLAQASGKYGETVGIFKSAKNTERFYFVHKDNSGRTLRCYEGCYETCRDYFQLYFVWIQFLDSRQ